MNICIHTISTALGIPIGASIEDMRVVNGQNADLQMLKAYEITGWSQTKDELEFSMLKNSPIKHELAINFGIARKASE